MPFLITMSPIAWEEAFTLIGLTLRELDSPHQAEFYTSGRTSNEAAFLYQLMVRAYGTNNFPDCSNMCHEASGYALIDSIGIGKGTVTMEDFGLADAIFVFGQNPGTNHPRMLETLRDAVKRGARVVCFNTLKERGLERFTDPQSPVEMLTNGFSPLNTSYYCPKIGGDFAAVRGMVKALLELEEAGTEKGMAVFDWPFIHAHTEGVDTWLQQVRATTWPHIEIQSGLTREALSEAAGIYASSEKTIFTWAMGITQHRHSVATIQEMVNMLLLLGNIGKPGAGACPVRGHSNVQGDRTMGINEHPSPAFLDRLEAQFHFAVPREPGHAVVEAIHAMADHRSKVFVGLGGNFAAAAPDTAKTEQALRQCDLTVHISTKLNRSHLVTGKQALILPCLGRTDIDRQASGVQHVTVEDSFSMVHSSEGVWEPLSSQMKSEPAIVAGIALATLGNHPIDWLAMAADYDRIRDAIAATIAGFEDFNRKIVAPGGFYLGNSARRRQWRTPTGKARMRTHALPVSILPEQAASAMDDTTLVLQTLRSHDQYNTSIYDLNDRYRGVRGERKVLFINREDMTRLGFQENELVTLTSLWNDGVNRRVSGFRLIPYDVPQGNLAAYFPETNPLVPLDSLGEGSCTPTSKSIAVRLSLNQNDGALIIGKPGH
jgi:molybdopterin-dependent oxidoreductase alpha subunit